MIEYLPRLVFIISIGLICACKSDDSPLLEELRDLSAFTEDTKFDSLAKSVQDAEWHIIGKYIFGFLHVSEEIIGQNWILAKGNYYLCANINGSEKFYQQIDNDEAIAIEYLKINYEPSYQHDSYILGMKRSENHLSIVTGYRLERPASVKLSFEEWQEDILHLAEPSEEYKFQYACLYYNLKSKDGKICINKKDHFTILLIDNDTIKLKEKIIINDFYARNISHFNYYTGILVSQSDSSIPNSDVSSSILLYDRRKSDIVDTILLTNEEQLHSLKMYSDNEFVAYNDESAYYVSRYPYSTIASSFISIYVGEDGLMYAIQENKLLQSSNNGIFWNKVGNLDYYGNNPRLEVTESNAMVYTSEGYVFLSTDNFNTWIRWK